MNLILHQFKTDVRHFRGGLIAIWALFASQLALASVRSMPAEMHSAFRSLLILLQMLTALFMVARLVQADALVGSSAGWMTRPARRTHLFWAKTAFLVLCLVLPRLAVESIIWAIRGFSFQLWLAASGESMLFSAAFLLLVAVLAAVTKDLPRFFLAAGLTVGGLFVWVVFVELLVRVGLLVAPKSAFNSDSLRNSAQAIAWLVFVGCAGLAWVWQVTVGWTRRSIVSLAVGLLAFVPILTAWRWNFLIPRTKPALPVAVELMDPSTLPAGQSQDQLLWSRFRVTGLPPRHIAVAEDMSAVFVPKDTKHAAYRFPDFNPSLVHGTTFNHRPGPAESAQQVDYFRTIRNCFPPETLWFGSGTSYGLNPLPGADRLFRNYTNHPPPGRFQGNLELDVFEIVKAAEAPLRPASFALMPGQRVTILRVAQTPDGIVVDLDESAADLMFDRDMESALFVRRGGFRESAFTYVLYHQRSGEAMVLSQNWNRNFLPSILGSESHEGKTLSIPYPALRERLAGISVQDWLHESRLCIFVPVYQGTTRAAFNKDDYTLLPRGSAANYSGIEAIKQATLALNPTREQVAAYLDTLFTNVSDSWNESTWKEVQDKILEIRPNGLPELIHRLPLDGRIESHFARPALRQMATRDNLPELRVALRRDMNLVSLFTEKEWEADARDVLVGELDDHRIRFSADALRIAAEARDPATYANLAWHFVRLNSDHNRVIPALAQCPGFDLAAAVREAWKRARFGLEGTRGLAAAAAAQGLPDALNIAVVNLEESSDKQRRQSESVPLAALTGYTGPAEGALPWLSANLDRFHFDPAQRKYVVESGQ